MHTHDKLIFIFIIIIFFLGKTNYIGSSFQEVVSSKIVLIANPEIQNAEDNLITLSALNQPSILQNLSERYLKNFIYTYCGTILIAGQSQMEI